MIEGVKMSSYNYVEMKTNWVSGDEARPSRSRSGEWKPSGEGGGECNRIRKLGRYRK